MPDPDLNQEHVDDNGNIVRTDSGHDNWIPPGDRDQAIKDAEDEEKKKWEDNNLLDNEPSNNSMMLVIAALLYYFFGM